MTPQEKAKELLEKFFKEFNSYHFRVKDARKAAIMCVDEILTGSMIWNAIDGERRIFWNQVKEEIEKLK